MASSVFEDAIFFPCLKRLLYLAERYLKNYAQNSMVNKLPALISLRMLAVVTCFLKDNEYILVDCCHLLWPTQLESSK